MPSGFQVRATLLKSLHFKYSLFSGSLLPQSSYYCKVHLRNGMRKGLVWEAPVSLLVSSRKDGGTEAVGA